MTEQTKNDPTNKPIEDKELERVDGGSISGGLGNAPDDQHGGTQTPARRGSQDIDD
jgi:hypothetical protein